MSLPKGLSNSAGPPGSHLARHAMPVVSLPMDDLVWTRERMGYAGKLQAQSKGKRKARPDQFVEILTCL